MYNNLVILRGQNNLETISDCQSFWIDSDISNFIDRPLDPESLLDKLTHKVSRNPADLLAHLRRIHCCFANGFSRQLYAALLDLLIVLNGKGTQLSRKLIVGCASRLDANMRQSLRAYSLKPNRMRSEIFSLLHPGIIGHLHLVDYVHHGHVDRDFLALAHDFIEYSQLDEAMDVLEQGLLVDAESPEAQTLLLELYRSTFSEDRFNKQFQILTAVNASLIDGWEVLKRYFDGEQS